jgi:predicted MFS family arabinose efflux permease
VTGISLGTAVGGVVIEHAGVTWSLALAAPSALAAGAVVLALRGSLAPAQVAVT